MKISIIIPSFQQAHFLERTILSLTNQNYSDLELIIVDGGSTDYSVNIIKKYEKKLSYWVSEKDTGQSNAINKGLKLAQGEILGWLNSDDTLAPNALRKIAECYQKNPDVNLVYGHNWLINENDEIIRRLTAVQTNAYELIYYNRNVWSQPGTTWRRRLQEKIGFLDESLHYTMDCDFWIRASQVGQVYCLNEHLGDLRIHNATKSKTQKEKFKSEHRILDRRYGQERRDLWSRQFFNFRRRLRILSSPNNWYYLLSSN